MALAVHNTHPDRPFVTLFGRLTDGRFAAVVMPETSVPYSAYWDDSIEQKVVYIEPDEDELVRMVDALEDGRLDFGALQNYGASNGGISEIPL